MRRYLLPVAVIAFACPPCAFAADSDTLVGIHWWGLKPGTDSYSQGIDPVPADLLDSKARGAWDVEVVNTHGDEWQKAGFFQPLYSDLYRNKNVSILTRLEYKYGQTVPSPSTINTATWAGNVVSTVNQLKDYAHVWQLGNEPNLIGEGGGWTNNQITPGGYAQVYKTVRDAIHTTAQVGAPGPHELLVAPVSPGGVIAGVRWQDGNAWLGQTIDALKNTNTPIDGFALHAYGGGNTTADALRDFRNGFAQQVAVIDSKGQTAAPIHITEMNRGITAGAPSATEEQRQADFARGALAMLDRWNRIPGNHNIVSAGWFVYDGLDSRWDSYSIEYWKDHGNAAGNSGDLYTAYSQIARAGYHAGLSGTRPLPPGVKIFDDFETGNGRYEQSEWTGASGTKVRTADDSYTKTYAQKLSISDNASNPNGWSVRLIADPGTADRYVPLTTGADGNVGFFLRVASNSLPQAPLMAQVVLDTEGFGTSDAGVPLTIASDGEWHFYEWNLDDPAQWTVWRSDSGTVLGNSDGILPTNGQASIDSIILRGGNANVELYFDGVMYNASGSLSAMLPVPEPTGLTGLALGATMLLRRRARK